jgi:hypothetical protein
MSQRGSGRIDIGPDDALPDLLLRVRATRGDEAVIAIPDSSSILLTASEFRTLKSTADQVRVAITLETNDKLRTQLASMFGFAHAPYFTEDELAVVDEHPSWPTPDSRLVASRVSIPMGDLTTSKPWRDEPVDASSGYSVPPKPVPRPEFAMEPRTGAIAKQEPDARAKTKPSTIIGVCIGLIAALAIAAVLSIVLRTAEITVRTARKPVSTALTVGYSTDGSDVSGVALTFPAEMADFTVPYTVQVPATGVLDNQGGLAGGAVQLRNISGKAITLPPGTKLQLVDGTTYLTTAEVKIPRGDVDAPGKAEVAIKAEKSGTTGNRAAGTLTGQIAEMPGLYFGNPGSAITGGTDVIIKVLTEQDLAAARDNAISGLDALARTFKLPDGRLVISSTVELVGEVSVQADHVAGDQVDTANVSAQAIYRGLTIDPDDLPDAARTEIRNQLTVRVPSGYTLTDDPIALVNPSESNPGSGVLTVEAVINAAAQLTPEMTRQIQEIASDQSEADARAALAAVPGVEIVDIRVAPALLVSSLPDAGKIEVIAK